MNFRVNKASTLWVVFGCLMGLVLLSQCAIHPGQTVNTAAKSDRAQ